MSAEPVLESGASPDSSRSLSPRGDRILNWTASIALGGLTYWGLGTAGDVPHPFTRFTLSVGIAGLMLFVLTLFDRVMDKRRRPSRGVEEAEEQLEAAIAAPMPVRFANEEARRAFEEMARVGREAWEKAHDADALERAQEAQRRLRREEAAERAQLALAKLWGVTHARLRDYHGIALGQAKRSFWTAQGAMIAGFLFLVGFAIVALKADSTAASAAAAVLGTVAAALAGFVSRTFIRSQEAAAAHLQRYFDQPLEFSRYLAAERLINDSDLTREERAAAIAKLVDAMISGPVAASPEAPLAVENKPPAQAAPATPAA